MTRLEAIRNAWNDRPIPQRRSAWVLIVVTFISALTVRDARALQSIRPIDMPPARTVRASQRSLAIDDTVPGLEAPSLQTTRRIALPGTSPDRQHTPSIRDAWRGRSISINGQVTWLVAHSVPGTRLSVALSARRRASDGTWDRAELDVAGPQLSASGLLARARLIARFDPVHSRHRAIVGFEPSHRVASWLSVTASYRMHFEGAAEGGPSLVGRGVRLGWEARLAPGTSLTAIVSHGEIPGPSRLDLYLRRGR